VTRSTRTNSETRLIIAVDELLEEIVSLLDRF